MILNANKLIPIFIFFILCGSFFYIIVPAVSLSFIITIISILFVLKNKIAKYNVDILSIVVFSYFVFLATVGLLVNPSYENLQYLKSFVSILIVFMFFLGLRNKGFSFFNSILVFTFFIFSIALLQFSFLMTGYGINPVIKSLEGYDLNLNTYGVRSIFSNPNDFSVILILLSVYFFISQKSNLLILSGFFVFFAGSRTAMFLYSLLLLLFYFKQINIKKIISLISLMVFSFIIYVFYLKNNADLYSIRRFSNIFTDLGGDGSIQVRFSNIVVFFDNFSSLYFGGWAAKSYSIYSDPIFYVNPHSFIIEIVLLYGIYGLIFLTGIFFTVALYLSKNSNISTLEKIICGFIFFMITFVPSSILNFPTFWALLFIILVSHEKKGSINV
ncbi:hypothetical protein NI467_05275 [Acinetobacter bohemicus]|uniref:O-antigen ligase family protein n=1 Tax=Acinetobacter sp. S4397-1 TaxID=2972915 RepID=UPI00209AB4C3|nr:O-antigen ligase family protein [Acinetobacter sp. S4397-1]MCO8044767.1 hypothetical protein [Acinetobacter sp. S4397-1]